MTDTAENLLNVAEGLFGEHGVSAVSLRQIVQAADANIGSVHYHFGSKEDLIRAVVRRRLEQVNSERLRRLEELRGEHGSAPIPLQELIRAFIEAPMHLSREGEHGQSFIRLVARSHSEAHPVVREELRKELAPVARQFLAELQRTLPSATPDQLGTRLGFTAGAMVHTALSSDNRDFAKSILGTMKSGDDLVHELVQFCVAGFHSLKEEMKE